MVIHTQNLCSAFNPSKVHTHTHTQTQTHTHRHRHRHTSHTPHHTTPHTPHHTHTHTHTHTHFTFHFWLYRVWFIMWQIKKPWTLTHTTQTHTHRHTHTQAVGSNLCCSIWGAVGGSVPCSRPRNYNPCWTETRTRNLSITSLTL